MEYKLTDNLTKKWLAPKFIIPAFEELFGIKFHQSDKNQDMIGKIDILSIDDKIKIQIKTRQPGNDNYTVHTEGDFLNNDYIVFFECPFTDLIIKNHNFLNDFNALYNYMQNIQQKPMFYSVPANVIRDNNTVMQRYYLISKDIVETYSIKSNINDFIER
jgi:hypothetical protein